MKYSQFSIFNTTFANLTSNVYGGAIFLDGNEVEQNIEDCLI